MQIPTSGHPRATFIAARPVRSGRHRWAMVLAPLILLLSGVVLLGSHGCAGWVAHALVDAPNANARDHSDPAALPAGVNQQLRVEVGPPAATLSLWIIDPPDAKQTVRGTILVLHGIRDTKATQVNLGRTLASEGWRAVLVDLRGHGESTGDWLTYGIVESRDLAQALNDLKTRGLLAGDIGVLGSSYGGSIGLQLAGIDSRIKAVVAVASFANVHDLIRRYAQQMNLSWLLSDHTIDDGFAGACALAGCDLALADPSASIARSDAHVLLIHGKRDCNIPFQHSERIAQAAGARARLILLDEEDHVSVFRDRAKLIEREAVAFFDARLSAK